MSHPFKVEILTTCKACTAPLTGRLRTYCSKACRDKSYRERPETKQYRARLQLMKYDKRATAPDPLKLPCAICGKYYRRPVRHAYLRHGVTEREYKESAGLDVKRGILTPDARERMAEHARANGTIHNLQAGERHRWSKNNPPPEYVRSPETMERLRLQGLKIARLRNNK